MIATKKDITILLVLLVATFLCVRLFYKKMSDEQFIATVEPMSLIVPTPKAILVVNRPEVFHQMILPVEPIQDVFSQYTPSVFHDLIQTHRELPSFLLSYYPQGTIMYAAMDRLIANDLFQRLNQVFAYPAQQRKEHGMTVNYFADSHKRFLVCYYYKGMFVASYNRRLVLETAQRQLSKKDEVLPEIKRAIRQKSENSAIQLFVPTEPLNLYVQTTDSTEWRIQDKWFSTDLFYSEGKICCLNELKYEASLDSINLYQSLSDTIEARLNQLFPQIKTTTHVSHDEAVAYFTICGQ